MSHIPRPSLSGIHHVAIIATDIERSKSFYADTLGFSVLRENYRDNSQSWKIDLLSPCGVEIELFSFPKPPARPSYPEAAGLRHLALRVEGLADWVRYLETQDIACEGTRTDPYTGALFTFFADPDGLPIELYQTVDAND